LKVEGIKIPFKSLNRVEFAFAGRHNPSAQAGGRGYGVGRRGERIAEDTRRDGQGYAGRRYLCGDAALAGEGIRVAFFLQFGYLGETREDIEKTIRCAAT